MKEIAPAIEGTLLIVAIFALVIWQVIKSFRDRKKPGRTDDVPNIVYGAWQGHNLGTTTFGPDDMEKLERELRQAGDSYPQE